MSTKPAETQTVLPEIKVDVLPAAPVQPADAARKALRAFIKYPNAKNYNAVIATLIAIQKEYIADFQIGAQ